MKGVKKYFYFNEAVFYHSLSKGYVEISENGKDVLWIIDDETRNKNVVKRSVLSFDLLKNMEEVRKNLSFCTLKITFQNKYFFCCLCVKQRSEKLKKMEKEIVFAFSKGNSVFSALNTLNNKLLNPEPLYVEPGKVINLALVKKRLEDKNNKEDQWYE